MKFIKCDTFFTPVWRETSERKRRRSIADVLTRLQTRFVFQLFFYFHFLNSSFLRKTVLRHKK